MSSTFHYPRVQKADNSLVVEFAPRASGELTAQMPMVLDLNRFGEIIAIEMISIKHFGGPNLFQVLDLEKINESPSIRFTYDESCDASYLRLVDDRSPSQRCIHGKLVTDRLGHLVAVEVPAS